MAKGNGAFTDRTRALIRDRADNRCEYCGLRIMGPSQIHHRQPRGMGGTSSPIVSSPANGILVHPNCHMRIESRRSDAVSSGYLVISGEEPHKTPIRLWDGWFLLQHDGTRQPTEPSDGYRQRG